MFNSANSGQSNECKSVQGQIKNIVDDDPFGKKNSGVEQQFGLSDFKSARNSDNHSVQSKAEANLPPNKISSIDFE